MTEQELVDLLTMQFQREADRSFIVMAGSTAPPLLPRLARECLRQMRWSRHSYRWANPEHREWDNPTDPTEEPTLAPPEWKP